MTQIVNDLFEFFHRGQQRKGKQIAWSGPDNFTIPRDVSPSPATWPWPNVIRRELQSQTYQT